MTIITLKDRFMKPKIKFNQWDLTDAIFFKRKKEKHILKKNYNRKIRLDNKNIIKVQKNETM
jgi:hypothetical protein